MGSNGAVTVLTKSITPYQFSSEGMIKAANRQQPQHHYRVSSTQHTQSILNSTAAAAVTAAVLVMQAFPDAVPAVCNHLLRQCTRNAHPFVPQVSEQDIFVIKTLGRGASSVVRCASLAWCLAASLACQMA